MQRPSWLREHDLYLNGQVETNSVFSIGLIMLCFYDINSIFWPMVQIRISILC